MYLNYVLTCNVRSNILGNSKTLQNMRCSSKVIDFEMPIEKVILKGIRNF